jgi:hypothetical protein
VVIRFSDVLLMYAEAVNEINNGPTPLAIAAFEEVRKRAYTGNTGMIGSTATDKAGFFNAIVKERYLEFGHEGIRKYDLLRWNLLAAKIAETRAKLVQIRDAAGSYANVPDSVWWKNNGEEIQFYTTGGSATAQPFWRPKQKPSPTTGWTALPWGKVLNTNVIDGLPLQTGLARFFVTGKSELYPYDQATLDSYQGRLKQNPNY